MVLSLSILTALLAPTIGCSGNRSTPAPAQPAPATTIKPSPPAPAAPADNRPVLVCFGDSLTAGFGTDPGQSYPDNLQKLLDSHGYRYRVDNEGVSGATSKDGVERLPDIEAIHPAIVVVEFGGNDGLRGLPIEDTRQNMDQIVGTLKRDGAKVALAGITLPPDYGPDYIVKFNDTYTVLQKKYRVPLLPFLLQGVYGSPGMMQRDQTHATAKGNAVVAGNVFKLLLPVIQRPKS
jgi:acyl-CoA thioesterase-1